MRWGQAVCGPGKYHSKRTGNENYLRVLCRQLHHSMFSNGPLTPGQHSRLKLQMFTLTLLFYIINTCVLS